MRNVIVIKNNECYVATINNSSDFSAETIIKVHDSDSGPLVVENFNLKFVFGGKHGIIPNYNFEDIKDESVFRKKYKDFYQRVPNSCWTIPLQIPFDWIDELE